MGILVSHEWLIRPNHFHENKILVNSWIVFAWRHFRKNVGHGLADLVLKRLAEWNCTKTGYLQDLFYVLRMSISQLIQAAWNQLKTWLVIEYNFLRTPLNYQLQGLLRSTLLRSTLPSTDLPCSVMIQI